MKTSGNESEGEIIFNHGTSNSKDVAILFPKNRDFEQCEKRTDIERRLTIAKVKINSVMYILYHLYAPTRDHKLPLQSDVITHLIDH